MRKFALLLLCFISCSPDNKTESAEDPKAGSISIFQPYEINGTEQWILIESTNKKNPILLYLSGGPGISMIPWAHINTITPKMLEEFTVVHWDQRGTGLSYDPHIPKHTITIEQYIQDTREVIKLLKTICDQDEVYLLGHSWGAILGTLYCQRYHETVTVYIGVGQAVTYYESEEMARKWLINEIKKAGNKNDLNRINSITWADRDLIRKYGGTFNNITRSELISMRSTSPYFPEKYYRGLAEKGVALVRRSMREELWNIDFRKQVPELKVPVYFFIGRYDYVTPWEMALEYFDMLKAPVKKVIWFEKSAHRPDIEEPEKFQQSLINILYENTE
jgi:pimeloyl-ACP methyl ester carboxylesterase